MIQGFPTRGSLLDVVIRFRVIVKHCIQNGAIKAKGETLANFEYVTLRRSSTVEPFFITIYYIDLLKHFLENISLKVRKI